MGTLYTSRGSSPSSHGITFLLFVFVVILDIFVVFVFVILGIFVVFIFIFILVDVVDDLCRLWFVVSLEEEEEEEEEEDSIHEGRMRGGGGGGRLEDISSHTCIRRGRRMNVKK